MSIGRRFCTGIVLVLFYLSIVPSMHAKSTDRDWKDGIILDSNTERGTRVVPTGNGEISHRNDVTYYQIDDGKIVYVVARTLLSRRDSALDVTINGHVQFAIEGATCYLRDSEGKEHKLSIEKKIAKTDAK